jgi:tetratricopeptide (TPR) repeat protein
VSPHPNPLLEGEGVDSSRLGNAGVNPEPNVFTEDSPQATEKPPLPQGEGWGEGIIKQLKSHWRKLAITLGLLSLVGINLPHYLAQYQQALEDGHHYLNMGEYAHARDAYHKALAQHPLRQLSGLAGGVFGDNAEKTTLKLIEPLLINNPAHLGLEKTSVFIPPDEMEIKRKLQQLEKKYPKDVDIQVFWGKFYVSKNNPVDLKNAVAYYQKALLFDPQNAEAYFGLSYCYDTQGQTAAALDALSKAVEFSSEPPPSYILQLAYLYSQQQQYDQALAQLAKLGNNVPLALFERAKLHRLTKQLEPAWRLQQQVIDQLDDPAIMGQLDNQAPWYFKTDHD